MGYYDSISSGYDELHKDEQLPKITRAIEHLQDEDLPEEGSLLDVGCGTGFSLDIISETLQHPCSGVDPSEGMIKQYDGKQQILLAAAENLPFPDKSFIAVVSFTALHHCVDHARAVLEIKRVAKKSAPIIITCLKRSVSLETLAAALADHLRVESVEELEKDIIFFCRRV